MRKSHKISRIKLKITCYFRHLENLNVSSAMNLLEKSTLIFIGCLKIKLKRIGHPKIIIYSPACCSKSVLISYLNPSKDTLRLFCLFSLVLNDSQWRPKQHCRIFF